MDKKIILGALGSCTSRKDVESLFRASNIESIEEKKELLLATMEDPELFFSNRESELEQQYELVMESFLSMAWKFAQIV